MSSRILTCVFSSTFKTCNSFVSIQWVKKLIKKKQQVSQPFVVNKKKRIRMDMLFSLAGKKIIQCNHGVLKILSINQSESSVNYMEVFIFSNINQSESSIIYNEIFIFFNTNKTESSLFITKFLSFLISNNQYRAFLHSNICGINQSEWSIHRF